MDQRAIVDGLRSERKTLRDLLAGLDDAGWEHASLCEGWRVRDVVAHLAGNCADVIAGRLDRVGSAEGNQAQIDERSSRTPGELLAEWDETATQVEALYENLPADVWEAALPGLGTVGLGVLRQLEDLWVHAQDIRIPLEGVAVAGPGTFATLEILAHHVADRCVRHSPDVSAITIDAGEFTTTISCGHRGDEVTVRGGPVTLALVATGRVPLSLALEDGTVSIEPAVPKGLADALNIYGP